MYDSVNADNLPNASFFAAYIDGIDTHDNYNQVRARFPSALIVQIAVYASTNGGTVLDVENGDATADQAPGWCAMRRDAGAVPTVYTSEANWQTVRDAFFAQYVAEPYYWIAGYPGAVGVGNLYPGSIAHQYEDTGLYDISAVADYWPGVDPAPKPAPNPSTWEYEMYATDPDTHIAYTTDPSGNFYGNGAVPVVRTLTDVRNKYGGAAGTLYEPCVGVTPETDVDGSWGYTYITKPGTPNAASRLGPYNAYHINRDGTF